MKKIVLFLRLALPYISVIIIPFALALFFGRSLIINYNEKAVETMNNEINQSFSNLCSEFEYIERLSNTIAMNPAVASGLHLYSNAETTQNEYIEIKNCLANYLIDDNIANIYVYDKIKDKIISPFSVYSNPREYFSSAYKIYNSTSDESYNKISNLSWTKEYSPVKTVDIDSVPTEVIEYTISIPVSFSKNSKGYLCVGINASKVFDGFENIINQGGEIYLLENNKIMYKSGSKYLGNIDYNYNDETLKLINVENKKIYNATLVSDKNNLKMIFYIPQSANFTEHIRNIKKVGVFVILSLLFSVFICMFFAYKKNEQINEIVRRLKKETSDSVETGGIVDIMGYNVIKAYMNDLIGQKSNMNLKINEYEKLKKSEFFNKIVCESLENEAEIEKEMRKQDINFSGNSYIVLAIEFGREYRIFIKDDITIKDFTKEILSKIIGRNYVLVDTSSKECACILPFDYTENAEQIVINIIANINVELKYCYEIDLKVTAGSIVYKLKDIHESYLMAKTVKKYLIAYPNKQLYLYSDLKNTRDMYYCSREAENKLYNYIMVGNSEKANEILRKIFTDNFENKHELLSIKAINNIKTKIVNSLKDIILTQADIMDENDIKAIDKLNEEVNINNFFENCYSIVDSISNRIGNRVNMKNSPISGIVKYIKENFDDRDLSLKKISVVFNMHENYISKLFKTYTGENISVVIENIRIDKACELMQKSNIKINEISAKVGYNSDESFRRAFKKVKGISPSQYRNTIND